MTQHRHQRHYPRPAAHKENRRLTAPDEVGGKRTPDLDLITLDHDLVKVRGDLAVGEQVDRQLYLSLVERRGGDRIGTLGAVAVGGGQADVIVLAWQVRHPHRQVDAKRLHARRLLLDRGNSAELPAARGALFDRSQSVQ